MSNNFVSKRMGMLGSPDSPEMWHTILTLPKAFKACKRAKRILVVAGGHGTEVDVLVELHGKQILSKITFVDKHFCFVNEVKRRHPGMQMMRGDFLKMDFDMDFDVVIGNPPYALGKDKSFYIKFIHKVREHLRDGGEFHFVIPNRFLNPRSNAAKSMSSWLDADYVMTNLNEHFPGISTDIGALGGTKSKSPATRDIPFYLNNGNFINRKLSSPCPTVNPNQYSIGIIDKISRSSLPKMQINNGATDNYVYISVMYQRHCPLKDTGGPLRFNTMINNTDGLVGSRVQFDSNKAAEVNAWFLSDSKLGRFITHSFASVGFSTSSPVHHGFMPIIPSDTELSDQSVYKIFNLTSDEIQYLENDLLCIFNSQQNK